jgi:hypothetical protein
MPIRLVVCPDYGAVEPHWRELERTYRGGELTHDLEVHRIIWEGFYRGRGAVLRIHVALEEERCVGIIPLLHTTEDADGHWTFTDDFLIGREYFCFPCYLPRILPHLPPDLADDLSCFYTSQPTDSFRRVAGAVVDIGPTQEAYFASLDRKDRYQLRRTWKANADLAVEVAHEVRWMEIQALRERYLELWTQRARGNPDRVSYGRDKVATDLALMARAQAMGKLLALYIRREGALVAAKFSVLRDTDRVDVYLCLRDPAEAHAGRALGVFAVLRNMEACRARGVRCTIFRPVSSPTTRGGF